MPFLGWIDFSNEYRNQTLKMLDLLREPGAIDELGVGVVRDAFADRFFPGTSTIQTRAKYFLLVPWILQDMEEHRIPSRDFLNEMQKRELGYISTLVADGSDARSSGIIGSVSKDKLKRKPSEIYWHGISRFGIAPIPGLSLSQYISTIDEQYKRQSLAEQNHVRVNEGDGCDDRDIERGYRSIWRVCPPPEGWKTRLSIALDEEEARFLKDRIVQSVPDSLMGIILRDYLDSALPCESMDQFPFLHSLPQALQEDVHQALDFSNLLEGAHIRYNMMIQLSRGEAGNPRFVEEFEVWEDQMKSFPWNRWHVDEVCKKASASAHVEEFINSWSGCVTKRDWESADRLIRQREKVLKGGRSKLANPAKVTGTENWVGLRKMVFRWPDARNHLKDISTGLKAGSIDA
jgi:hypothetical protein